MEIANKKAVIVGGASGFGRATAEALAKRGADVAILDRPQSKGQEVADGLGLTFYPVDVTDFTGTEQVLQQAVDALGGLHIAVTTAGGGTAERTVKKSGPHSLDSFRSSVDLNLIGTFNVSRLSAWHMSTNQPEDDERGVIINTASIAGYEGQVGQIPYSAAKGGVIGMTLVAARDLAPLGIRVVTIAPGMFLTPAYPVPAEQLEAHWGPQIPFPKRMGQPAEYATLVTSIVENDYLNGEVIRLDGALRFPPK